MPAVFNKISVYGAGLLILLAGCSTAQPDDPLSVTEVAVEMLAGPIAEELDLGELQQVGCANPTQLAVGSQFPCSATTSLDQTIWADAIIDVEGKLEVNTRNAIKAAALASFEQAAIDALNDNLNANLTNDHIDCGDQSVVLNDENAMVCALRDPTDDEIFDLTLTMIDIEARHFKIRVAEESRS